MGKPKQSKNNPDIRITVKEKLGKVVLFIGLAGARRYCAACGTEFKRKVVSEYNKELFCGESCINAKLRKADE